MHEHGKTPKAMCFHPLGGGHPFNHYDLLEVWVEVESRDSRAFWIYVNY